MNIGQHDQIMEAMKDLATIVRNHYQELIKAGFTSEEALQLTVAFQRDVMLSSK